MKAMQALILRLIFLLGMGISLFLIGCTNQAGEKNRYRLMWRNETYNPDAPRTIGDTAGSPTGSATATHQEAEKHSVK